MGPRADESGTITLDEGVIVPYRPIEPSDREALQRFHGRHSDRSTYLRFFAVQRVLGETQARYFTELDGENRFALVALDPGDPREIIAVVRFDRDESPTSAEYAAIVDDAWQGRGLGTELTKRLIASARARGVRTLVAFCLPENIPMLSLFRDLHLPEEISQEGYIERVELDITVDPDSR
jgi:RimJ/RimL family protein N-acetyltransferase